MNRCALLLAAMFLAGCASSDQAKMADSVATPLNDLNLVHAEIPETLVQAQKAPYAVPVDSTCAGLMAEIQALDEVLGPDLDTPASKTKPSLIERGGGLAVGAVQKTAEGVVPFRSWVRKLTGAERYSKKVAAALVAGTVRRAYFKGIFQTKECKAPEEQPT